MSPLDVGATPWDSRRGKRRHDYTSSLLRPLIASFRYLTNTLDSFISRTCPGRHDILETSFFFLHTSLFPRAVLTQQVAPTLLELTISMSTVSHFCVPLWESASNTDCAGASTKLSHVVTSAPPSRWRSFTSPTPSAR